MRPVNLIPAEERRGGQAPLRSGPAAYIVVGALVAALAAVTALVLTGNQISEYKSEIVQLQREDAIAKERAESLASYTQFASLTEQRIATVSSLADSRFDWERVMRELSLVLPDDAWLVSLTASASGAEGGEGGSGGGGSLRGAIPGPALEISGCAAGQEAFASFVTELKDIDGVTRVGVESSELGDQQSAAGASGGGEASAGGSNDDCRTRDFIAKFDLVIAFDAAPVPVAATAEAPVAAPAEAEASTESSETEGG
jgi:Tfp pilus assembly protein PilN